MAKQIRIRAVGFILSISILGLLLFVFITSQYNTSEIVTTTLAFPLANYTRLVYINGKLIAFAPDTQISDHWLYSFQESTSLQPLMLQDDPACSIRTVYNITNMRPDKRLEIRKMCHTSEGGFSYLMAYDWNTHVLQEVAGPLPGGGASRFATWNPESTQGLVHFSSYAFGTLYWITSENKYSAIDLDLAIQNGETWNLKDDFPNFEGGKYGKTGVAGCPAWSPDGKAISFFASTDAIGKVGLDRLYQNYSIYVMDPNNQQVTPLVDGFYFPTCPRWSPNSKYLLFTAEAKGPMRNGIWIYSIPDKKIYFLVEGEFEDVIWTPDEIGVVAIRCKATGDCSLIEMYSVSEFIRP